MQHEPEALSLLLAREVGDGHAGAYQNSGKSGEKDDTLKNRANKTSVHSAHQTLAPIWLPEK